MRHSWGDFWAPSSQLGEFSQVTPMLFTEGGAVENASLTVCFLGLVVAEVWLEETSADVWVVQELTERVI